MGMFDDLIPKATAAPTSGGMFDDLIPKALRTGFRDAPLPRKGFASQVGAALSGESAQPVQARSAAEVGQSYADIAGGALTGIPAGALGLPGDIESIGRSALSTVAPVSTETALPTSEQLGNAFAGGEPANQDVAAGRMLGSFIGPGGTF